MTSRGRAAEAEFDAFAVAAWPRLHWSARLLTGDDGLAEDLAQTALVRTYARWGHVRREDALAYARRVLVNLNIDRLRRRRGLEVGPEPLDQMPARGTFGADPAASTAHRDEVVRLLAGLTDRERRVVGAAPLLRPQRGRGRPRARHRPGHREEHAAPGAGQAPRVRPRPPDRQQPEGALMHDDSHVTELERMLEIPDAELLGRPDLDRIHRLGTRRRRIRLGVGLAAGALAVAAVAGTAGTLALPGGDSARGVPAASDAPAPQQLSPLAARALAEIPGAVQVSDWQVVIPPPGPTATGYDEKVTEDDIAAGTITVGSMYTGVTTFDRSGVPTWLYDAVQRHEQEDLAAGGSHPIGTTDLGVLVETAEADLACVGPSTDRCTLAFLGTTDGRTWTYEYGLGADHFMDPGAPMQVFLHDDYSRGTPAQVVVAGLDGTDVGSADVVTTDGERVRAHVLSGTLHAGDTVLWAYVEGQAAEVVAYDAAGEVIEDHPLRPCDSPEDCEVR